ncbi:linamarin synthase 1-like [Eucalyptus grandis]|uniref:linamarin synthase 1-like n=1 Tax=Eucalyptus grandis TaxID=71139 RepID=UPI00192ED233|nr:linamarin synthase 1-like [Eucalyptus grandis]
MGSLPQESRKSHAYAHAVCVPFLTQGHINPIKQVAKLLHAHGTFVTFINTEFNHRRLFWSKGPDSLQGLKNFYFETIPDGLPPSDRDATQDHPALYDSIRKNCLGPFKWGDELRQQSRKRARLWVHGLFAVQRACQEWDRSIQSCGLDPHCVLNITNEDFLNNGTLDDPVNWIPGKRNIQLWDIPSFIRTTDPNDIMFEFLGEKDILASSIKSFRLNLWKEDYSCLEWLDQREAELAVYVNYGCVTVMTKEHPKEFVWGLANSKRPFM